MEYYLAIKKEGNLILSNSMDGHGEHYAKWNKLVSEWQIPYDLTYKRSLMNKNTLMGKMEPQAWKQLTVARGEGGGDSCWKKEKGLVKEHVWMAHGHGQWHGDWLWEYEVGWEEEGKWGKIRTTLIE